MTTPATNASFSPDTLPARGYTHEQLSAYIKRQLGDPVWEIEITPQHILDAIADALAAYNKYKPRRVYQAVQLYHGVYRYLDGVDLGQGVVSVDFVEPNPVPTELFYGNLIDPSPIFRAGLDEYDLFLRWRKTWMRVTSVRPDWLYDDYERVLYIHNPLQRYRCGVVAYGNHELERLPLWGADWVKQYALAKARYTYGEVLAKFSGAIPGPVKDLALDNTKREKAEVAMKELEQTLFNAQEQTPIMVD